MCVVESMSVTPECCSSSAMAASTVASLRSCRSRRYHRISPRASGIVRSILNGSCMIFLPTPPTITASLAPHLCNRRIQRPMRAIPATANTSHSCGRSGENWSFKPTQQTRYPDDFAPLATSTGRMPLPAMMPRVGLSVFSTPPSYANYPCIGKMSSGGG